MKAVTYSVLVIGVLGTLAVMVHAGGSAQSLVSGFTLWAVLPYVVFAAACALSRVREIILTTLIASVVGTLFAALIYIDAFFIHISSTSALVFIFIPLYQLIAAGIVLLVSFIARRSHATPTI